MLTALDNYVVEQHTSVLFKQLRIRVFLFTVSYVCVLKATCCCITRECLDLHAKLGIICNKYDINSSICDEFQVCCLDTY